MPLMKACCLFFSLSVLSKSNVYFHPFRINTGDKTVERRSYSVVAHHEGLSSLRPGFKSRYEHSEFRTLTMKERPDFFDEYDSMEMRIISLRTGWLSWQPAMKKISPGELMP